MVESTCFQHTSSHPDKFNNSVNRIISKEEETEDPRRDTSSLLRVQWCFHIQSIHSTRTTVFPHAIQQSLQSSRAKKTILHTELILLQESSKKYYNYKAHPVQFKYKASSSDCSRVSKHSIRQNPAIRPLQYKQAFSNSTQQKQHSRWQPASTHSLQ